MEYHEVYTVLVPAFAEIAESLIEEEARHKEAIASLRKEAIDILEFWATDEDASLEKTEFIELCSILYFEYSDLLRASDISPFAPPEHSSRIGFKKLMKQYYKGIPATCSGCGAIGYASPSERRTSKQEVNRTPVTGLCETCRNKRKQEEQESRDKWFELRDIELRRLRTMPYAEYLKTPHWDDTRKRALKRAHYKCQLCNTGNKSLQVHHRTYENRGDERNADLIVLCADCHCKFHDIVGGE